MLGSSAKAICCIALCELEPNIASQGSDMDPASSPLLTDLYQLNMVQAYLDHGETKTAVFEFFVRKLPAQRRFLMAAGLEPPLDFLENLRFSPEDLEWVARSGRFSAGLLDYLATSRFRNSLCGWRGKRRSRD